MTDQTAPIPDFLLRHLAERETARNTATAEAYAALTEREQRLVREAAVMGYVQGTRHPADEKHPKDSWVTALVVQECLAFPDLYPTMNAVRDAARQATGQPDTEAAASPVCECQPVRLHDDYREAAVYLHEATCPAVGQPAAPADRAAVLAEAADKVALELSPTGSAPRGYLHAIRDTVRLLRRMADEETR